jgi:hydrogenase maturation protein HypF
MSGACSIKIRGTVQGVGFRPFVFRLAHAKRLNGWVLNAGQGVEIHVEGADAALEGFVRDLEMQTPPAAHITTIEICSTRPAGLTEFTIRGSESAGRPSVHISPDLPVCEECVAELFDAQARRYGYPYINCTNCGPRYTILKSLPYDRFNTTMQPWPMDAYCSSQFEDPLDRRFHAQPVACPTCGPHYSFRKSEEIVEGDVASIARAASLLKAGGIVAIKGIGGYHLACDARNATAVRALRQRKFRREKPFALMAKNGDIACGLVSLTQEASDLLSSAARPIVVARSKVELDGVAPDNNELGVMLPYTPLHHLLFEAGAPDVLVMTSANRSNEPISYRDDDALEQLTGIADAFLIGERAIARPVDDSVVRVGALGATILRRGRGHAPGAVAALPVQRPVLALGGDLKNTITLVVAGHAFMSQHLGDLEHYETFEAFRKCAVDLVSMYRVPWEQLLVAHDLHPGYFSTSHALDLPAADRIPVQHHRAHIASVLAERHAWGQRVVGAAFDGTGYGEDGAIWGGELFVGSILDGFERAGHLRYASLPGGDAAARNPVQSAAGFLAQLHVDAGYLFESSPRFHDAARLVNAGARTFNSSSIGRLFDAAAAILGFTRTISFEGQAAMWLEYQARSASTADVYPFPFADQELDFRPLLQALLEDRANGRDIREIARAFHRGIANGLTQAALELREREGLDILALSGGVFQNDLLLHDIQRLLEGTSLQVWTNHKVPSNDGGISLGQAALAAFAGRGPYYA